MNVSVLGYIMLCLYIATLGQCGHYIVATTDNQTRVYESLYDWESHLDYTKVQSPVVINCYGDYIERAPTVLTDRYIVAINGQCRRVD